MYARLAFLGILGFWLTMNALLWRVEFGSRGGDLPVPLSVVWQKILTAPDASSMSVYQNGERMGYCEVATGVGQQMANYDEGKLPVDSPPARAGYLLHVAGNVCLGSFTNRAKFDGHLRLDSASHWQEADLKLTTVLGVVELTSRATNQSAHLKVSSDGARGWERDLTVHDLQNPATLLPLLMGSGAGDWMGQLELASLLPAAPPDIVWQARRTRVRLGNETVPVYRLETTVLGHPVVLDVSTLGEVLRFDLPGGISARIDEWNKP